jgi:hypothetical protein
MNLELYAEFRLPEGGAGLSQAQMIALAESTIGTLQSNQAVLDITSYNELDEADRAAGYDIQMRKSSRLEACLTQSISGILDGLVHQFAIW